MHIIYIYILYYIIYTHNIYIYTVYIYILCIYIYDTYGAAQRSTFLNAITFIHIGDNACIWYVYDSIQASIM